ncbi:unnamed protein product [Schistosoma rodhaini]|uniref:MEG-28 protein n=1 Tax=Schistosoma mansoni TaxID=6183 RepID=A0A0U5KKP6_SCHMA|nr:unnamed protein product [Schistosoma rodhaini]CUS27854.1 TPA: MEG-28 protein [Schistosoma mansoni]
MNTIVRYYLIILFIITTIEIQNIRSAFKKRPPASFVILENMTSTDRFRKLLYHCFTSFSTWMVLLG